VCVVTTNVTVNAPEARPAAPVPYEQTRRVHLAWNASRKHPKPLCRDCGLPFRRSERGVLHRDLCATCEFDWLDRIIRRLAWREGRKAAIRRLKALAK
jgi:hypothetical protein